MLNLIRYWLAPKQLKINAQRYTWLQIDIEETMQWCCHDSPEIACAMLYLQTGNQSISNFRDDLRRGKLTAQEFGKRLDSTHKTQSNPLNSEN